jgi:alpha-1,2-mannosyltransferase
MIGQASIGIHTMRDEHFGITIVEMMAAGLAMFTHKSAGALLDIIGTPADPFKQVGFLCVSEADYVKQLSEALRAKITQTDVKRYAQSKEHKAMAGVQQRAKLAAEKFSDESF